MFFSVVTCSSLSLTNGQITYDTSPTNGGYTVDTIASLTCDLGYTLSGSSSITCQPSGNWNQPVAICGESNRMICLKKNTYFY